MTARKKPLKSWIVRVRETVITEYVVDAVNVAKASARIDEGDVGNGVQLERIDWYIESVEENT
jgi:hypothetical protein